MPLAPVSSSKAVKPETERRDEDNRHSKTELQTAQYIRTQAKHP